MDTHNGQTVAIMKNGIPPMGSLGLALMNLYLDELDRMVPVVFPPEWKYFRYGIDIIVIVEEIKVNKSVPEEKMESYLDNQVFDIFEALSKELSLAARVTPCREGGPLLQ